MKAFADLILRTGRIYTVDDNRSWAGAVVGCGHRDGAGGGRRIQELVGADPSVAVPVDAVERPLLGVLVAG